MTYKQFLAALRKTPRTWKLIDGDERFHALRLHGYCVLGAVIKRRDKTPIVEDAAKILNISVGLAYRLASAGDGFTNAETRRDLLWACGLKERKRA